MQEGNQWTAQLNPVSGQFAGTKHDQVVGVLALVAFVSRIAQTADEAKRRLQRCLCGPEQTERRKEGRRKKKEEAAADRRQPGQRSVIREGRWKEWYQKMEVKQERRLTKRPTTCRIAARRKRKKRGNEKQGSAEGADAGSCARAKEKGGLGCWCWMFAKEKKKTSTERKNWMDLA